LRVLFITLFIVIADQVTKLLVKGFAIPFLNIRYDGMYHGQRIPIIGDFFRLTFVENPGMAFGYDPGSDFKLWISVFSLVASIGLILYLYLVRHQFLSLRIALAFILGGAIGNLIDRMFYGVFYGYAPLFYGKVVDFLDFDFFNISVLGRTYDRWPVFNIADAAVTIGVLVMIIFYNKHQKEIKQEDKVLDDSAAKKESANINDSGSDAAVSDSSEEIKQDKSDNGEPDNGKEIPF
jgi:signal peptidase II